MDVAAYISNQLDSTRTISYTKDYLGATQLLENSGFSPYADSTSPFSSTLYQIFNRFVEKTGLNTNPNTLKDEFLEQNPSSRQAIDLYGALENTFAAQGPGEKAIIVDFLNKKIDEFITENDADKTGTLTFDEADFTDTLFQTIDTNQDEEITASEIQDNFYNNFTQLHNVLNYFQNTRGVLIDIFA
jgi:hypothetical protein